MSSKLAPFWELQVSISDETHQIGGANMAEKKRKKHNKASTPRARETQLINLAYNLAEEQLREGTASPSIVNHFLKLSTQREELELENLRSKAKLQDAKAQQIDTAKENEELTKAAIEAMKNYSGSNGAQ